MVASMMAAVAAAAVTTTATPAMALVDESLSTEGTGLPFGLILKRVKSLDCHFDELWLSPRQAVETTKLEYGRGRGNFRWSSEMRRDRKEHQRRKHTAGPTLTLRDES
ncbi:hypothetical protein GOBAR_DD14377 [Gossypium barbadense]|nr:hypothetical protein GOBAR_DD14377 [Gossypium barbadense]